MKKKIIILIAGVVLAIGITTGCQKIKYKDDFRAPLVGKYICTVKAYNNDNDCYQKDLLLQTIMVEEVNIIGDSALAVTPLLSLKYNIADLPFDTVKFYRKSKFWGEGDSVYSFNNFNLTSQRKVRECFLTIDKDSFYLYIDENCDYTYYLSGKKSK